MKFLRNYNIDIIKLKEGKHAFTFEVNNEFFVHFEAAEWIQQGSLTVTVLLHKLSSLLEADFDINGKVRLTCDRSLEEFDYLLSTQEKVIYKYGQEEKEISEDVFMITWDTPSINVAQLIYEFILLAIPAKKIHPDYIEEMDEDDFEGEGELVYNSDAHAEDTNGDSHSEDSESSDETADPRWEALKKLKHKE